MSNLKFTTEQIEKALDSVINSPWQDVADGIYTSAAKQTIVADTEYPFQNNGVIRNVKNLPTHLTNIWDHTAHKAVFTEELDSPVYAARVQFTFTPSAAIAGIIEIKAYIDEPVPKLIQTTRFSYKKTEARVEGLFVFYIGAESGYNLKQYGLKFVYTSDGNGTLWDRGIFIYKT